MENKKISVIVPIYNVEKYLNRCVDSIINQTYKNLEIILVDDGSPDNCGKICDEYAKKDNRIKVVHKENGGVSSARNVGLNIATGDYIGFVDGDDWIDLYMYEKLLYNSIKYNSDITCCNAITYLNNKFIPSDYDKNVKVFSVEEFIKKLMLGDCQRSVWSMLYSKKIIKDTFFNENICFSEDYLFNYEVGIKSKKIVNIGQDLYYYFVRNTSMTNDYKYCNCRDRVRVAEIVFESQKYNKEFLDYALKSVTGEIYWSFNRIIVNNDIENFWNMHSIMSKYKKYIFKCKLMSLKYKSKFYSIYFFPRIYFKVKYKKLSVKHN